MLQPNNYIKAAIYYTPKGAPRRVENVIQTFNDTRSGTAELTRRKVEVNADIALDRIKSTNDLADKPYVQYSIGRATRNYNLPVIGDFSK